MIIGIDANEANAEKRVGVNQYGFDLLWSIYQLQLKETKKSDPITFILYLKNPPRSDMPRQNSFWKYKILKGGPLWIVTCLMPHLYFGLPKPDVLFTPSHYVSPFAPMPRVCSIMDLGYLEFSEQFTKYDFWQLKLWSAWSIMVSRKVIAISETTKNDIVRHYRFAKHKTQSTLLGYDPKLFNTRIKRASIERVAKQYAIVSDYVLFISTLKPSKNVDGLIEAWSKIVPNFRNIILVICGKKGWLYESIFEKVKRLGLANSIVFTDFLPEKDKPPLIAGAKAFVIPSFWEGFGLDAVSAMACGVPVVASNKGSLPEVIGDAGIIVDPYNINSIAEGITKVLTMSESALSELKKKGFARAGVFSWEKTAQETLEILKEAAE